MRYLAEEKLEIIRLVKQSHLPARQTLEKLGIRPSTFYRWYDRLRPGLPETLTDKPSKPDRVWKRIPDDVRERIVSIALRLRFSACATQAAAAQRQRIELYLRRYGGVARKSRHVACAGSTEPSANAGQD